jgi:cysteine synthase
MVAPEESCFYAAAPAAGKRSEREDALQAQPAKPTPVLRLGSALLKLELLRPSAGVDDRALPLWDRFIAPGARRDLPAVFAGSAGAALAAAGWARAHGILLSAVLHGVVPHEARESLRIWGLTFEVARTRDEALDRVAERERGGELALPPLDGDEAALAVAASLGRELISDAAAAGLEPVLLVSPAGPLAAVLGALSTLRERFPRAQAIALRAASASDELPELPFHDALRGESRPGLELRAVSREEAAAARAELARTLGLLAGHGAALAARIARDSRVPEGCCALALVTSAGEREFSLDAAASSESRP